MLNFLNQRSRSRRAWLLIIFTGFGLEMIALWFQYVKGLQPCTFCLYESYALFGVISAGLIGAIAPKTPLRYIALFIWLYSSWKGIELSLKHTIMQLHPLAFITCSFNNRFPNWLPLDQWLLPKAFIGAEHCSVHQWELLGLVTPQLLMGIFIIYFIVATLVAFSQFCKKKCS